MFRAAVRAFRPLADRPGTAGICASSARSTWNFVLLNGSQLGSTAGPGAVDSSSTSLRQLAASMILRNSYSALPAAAELEMNGSEKNEHEGLDKASQASGSEKGPSLTQLLPTKQGQKPRVVVLGSGWAACRLMKELNTEVYDIVCISPRNHMVFTPLLASTCVGTLEFRSVSEPVRSIQPALSKSPDSYYFHAHCTRIDPENHEVHCEALDDEGVTDSNWIFKVAYDKLVIASGAEPLTFNIKGVAEYATFLREVPHARDIRRRILLNLMLSDIPGVPVKEKERLLHCVVVGGGPTGVEFSGELSDFIKRDVHEKYSHVKDYVHVTLIEASEILSSFDVSLRQYAVNHLTKSGVHLVRGVVKEVFHDRLVLNDGTVVPYGVLVWSTGVGPSNFVKKLDFEKSPGGRIGVDEYLRVPGSEDVYAIGDCAGYLKDTGKAVLPALAQVAERQGKYLAGALNRLGQAGGGRAGSSHAVSEPLAFVYKHMGSMASVGRYKALVDLRENKNAKGISWAGFLSWFVWRSAYLTRVVSWRNRFYVAVNWATTFVFGRDISRF